jgi:predicted transcriptional regulator
LGEVFKRLQKQGCIKIRKKNRQIFIGLTEKGKKMAGWFQIDALKIKRPKNGMENTEL